MKKTIQYHQKSSKI